MKKRLLSILLVLAMCAALLPTIALADKPPVITLTQADFDNAGESGSPVKESYGHYVLPSGSYKLMQDITLGSYIEIPYDATVTLDLNGCTLLRSGGLTAISMAYTYNNALDKNVGGTLTLEDSSAEQTGKISGGTIEVGESCIFTMNGGTICDADSGVWNYGIFTMNGGKITNCKTIICNESVGKVELKEGTTLTGAVKNAGEFSFEGITFTGSVKHANTDHPIDGGIFHADADTVVENGFSYDATPRAGKITGGVFYSAVENQAQRYGSTYANAHLSIIEGGIFYGTVTNEFIDEDTGAKISGGVFYGEVINESKNKDAITGGVFYGEVVNEGIINGGVFLGKITEDGEKPTTSHNITLHFNDDTDTVKTGVVFGNKLYPLGEPPIEREGYSFAGWYWDADLTEKVDFDTEQTISGDVTLYAKWKSEAEGEGFVIAGGLLSGLLEGAANVLDETFVDVSRGAYYYNAVQWAAERGIAGGVDKKHFAPDESCTRAQAVTMLWRAAGCPEVWAENPFEDVDADDYYFEAVLWAVANGITSGADETHFSPDAPCTRGQIVTFLHRAARCYDAHEDFGFVDVKTGSYCEDAINWAVENAITNGTDVDTFSPDETCTRAQIVTFLYRNR